MSVLDDLVHHLPRQIHRHRKADTLVAARTAGQNRGVDADQFAAIVDQRSAGVAGIDGRVGLDEVFIVFDSQFRATGSADDSHGHGLSHAIGIADGEHASPTSSFAELPTVITGRLLASILTTARSISRLCQPRGL